MEKPTLLSIIPCSTYKFDEQFHTMSYFDVFNDLQLERTNQLGFWVVVALSNPMSQGLLSVIIEHPNGQNEQIGEKLMPFAGNPLSNIESAFEVPSRNWTEGVYRINIFWDGDFLSSRPFSVELGD